MNWIVLEGIDGSGKTTTARVLGDHGWEVDKTGPPGAGGSFPELIKRWWECEERWRPGQRRAWDRGHLGEQFCGPVRRGTELTTAALNACEALLLDREAEIWWLDPPPGVVRSEFPLGQRAAERFHLTEAARASRVPVRRFPSARHAQAHAVEVGLPVALEPLDPAGVGTRRPRWWVLGEQASPRAICSLPFVTPAGLDMLWPGVDPTRVRVSNVLLPRDDLRLARAGRFSPETLLLLRTSFGRFRPEPRVLALGGTAEAALRAAGLPVTCTMRHPQYIRRFYHQEVGNWASEFRELVT